MTDNNCISIQIKISNFMLTFSGNDIESVIANVENVDMPDIVDRLNALRDSWANRIQIVPIQDMPKEDNTNLFVNLETNSDKILGCFYLLMNSGAKVANKNDIETALEKFHLPKPQNVSDIINKLADRGHIAISKEMKDGLKSWFVTQDGMTYLKKITEMR